MGPDLKANAERPGARRLALAAFRWLASLQLAVILITLLAAVLAAATFVEDAKGTEYVHWYVYDSQCFLALLALLGANVLAATLIRFPWKRSQIGFLVTHAGLLVLLIGCVRTFDGGIEGHLSLQEGQTASAIFRTDRSQLQAAWRTAPGRPRPMTAVFAFAPGPVDAAIRRPLDLGEIAGVHLRLLNYYCHARTIEEWVSANGPDGVPALRFALAGPDGTTIREDWLVEDQFGPEIVIGPTRLQLHRAPADSMLEDFVSPPAAEDMDPKGVLSIHYQGHMQRIVVGESLGKKVPVGDSEISVEVAEYLANAKPSSLGRFTSDGDHPKNPLLELQVHTPGKEQPIRQIAFARLPFLNLDGIHGHNCPVKFWYHHPAISAESAVEFLQTGDGQLYCRVATGGKCQSRGSVQAGDRIETAGKFAISIEKYLPQARQDVHFLPVEPAADEANGADAAALVEVTAAGGTEQVWLKRNDAVYGTQEIATPDGDLIVTFGYESLPLDFAISLVSFKHGVNPGSMGDASFASVVRIVDKARAIDQQHEISMNQPLAYGKYVFYQSSFQETPGEPAVSILTAAYDPGRFLKYFGSLMVCLGTCLAFYKKAYSFLAVPFSRAHHRAADAALPPCDDGLRRDKENLGV
jgi:hypothetical protein